MRRFASLLRLLLFAVLLLPGSMRTAAAHDVPMTYLKMHVGQNGASIDMDVPWTGLRHDIPSLGGPDSTALPTAEAIQQNQDAIAQLITSHLVFLADGREQKFTVTDTTLAADKPVVLLKVSCPWRDEHDNAAPPPDKVTIRGNLFPTATNHQMMVSLYRGDALEQEAILSLTNPEVTHKVGGRQSIVEVVRQFIRHGIHHIFIGPDHILFIVGLLLAGGNLKTLLKVVTAFTAAHSITLALAVLGIFSLPSRFVEPTIALSIVFVGINTFLKKQESRDLRLYLAFGFGLIHGFGFAGALSETELPRYALGWSLFAFNVGVEIGQSCIVVMVAPLLALLAHYRPAVARWVIQAGALTVIFFGAVWFVQRLFGE
jgi:hydrogenase/urease accessory protein HupE